MATPSEVVFEFILGRAVADRHSKPASSPGGALDGTGNADSSSTRTTGCSVGRFGAMHGPFRSERVPRMDLVRRLTLRRPLG
jgi:hypothetical protein